ncbi:hypothetical protein EQG49_06540 [Periweissella cryptocerci]|uniref:Bacteriocin n=1 Tax=Periweissella cryptocerci TaxID=2506420 RepID=A0A4P6YTV6_9LACO|nr:hypothetical protein [Periweissella cryptocerci]QBO36140.1 hypothetical protein EQG49_06540 [Periweissella cryptocerci]
MALDELAMKYTKIEKEELASIDGGKKKKSSNSKTYPNGVHVSANGKVSVDWGGVAQGILGAFGNSLGHAY